MRYIYGISEQYNSGDSTYSLNSLMGKTFADEFDNKPYLYTTIWEGAGNDTLTWAVQNSVASIDLAPGNFSFLGKLQGPMMTIKVTILSWKQEMAY